MSAIETYVSSVDSFTSSTENQYKQLLILGQDLISRMQEMTLFVENEREKLQKQIIMLSEIEEKLADKLFHLKSDIEELSSQCAVWRELYYEATDPNEEARYKRNLENDRARLNMVNASLEEAVLIQEELKRKHEYFQQLEQRLFAMIDALKKNDHMAQSVLSLLGDETIYNSMALSHTQGFLHSYINLSPIYRFGSSVASQNVYSSASSTTSASVLSKETKRKTERIKSKTFKLKSGSFEFNSDGSCPLYKIYLPYCSPGKDILFEAMKGLEITFREAIMRQLGGVVFLSAKHNFNYSKDCRGRMLRIIGIDASVPAYSRQLLYHIGQQLFDLDKSKEKLSMESALSAEIARNMASANIRIQGIANNLNLKAASLSNKKHNSSARDRFLTSSSEFFSQYFRAYTSEEHEFLGELQSNFKESSALCEGIIYNLTHGK